MARPPPGQARLATALRDFSNELTPTERVTLDKTLAPSVESVAEFTAKLSTTTNTRRQKVGGKILPLLEFIQALNGVVGTFVQSNPEIAALVWGSVRFAVQFAAGYFEYFVKIEEFFERIGDLCPRVDRIGKLFPDSDSLRDAVWAFNAVVVEFCTATVKFLKGSPRKQFVRSVWKPYKGEFKEFEGQLKKRKEAIDDEVLIASQNAAFHANQSALIHNRRNSEHRHFEVEQWSQTRNWQLGHDSFHKKKKLESILDNISQYDHSRSFNNARDRRHPQTGDWFFELDQFKTWKASLKSNILWYHGIVGSGKTILTTALIEKMLNLNKNTKSIIVYFFCDFQTPTSLQYRTIMSSILRQLVFMSQPLKQHLDLTLSAAYLDAPHRPDIREIESMLIEVINSLGRVYIVTDGIDECSDGDRLDLLSSFKRLLRAKPNDLKILVSSRPEIDIPRRVQISQQISLTSVTERPELEAYILEELEQRCLNLEHHSDDLKQEIKTALMNGADGMFLWVYFQIEDIKRFGNESDIRNALKNLPRGLHETYARILKRISDQRDSREAVLVFKWLAECRRPLTLAEIQDAVSIRLGDTHHDTIVARYNKDPLGIIRNCCNLVIVNDGDSTVQFAHATVAEYIRSSDWKPDLDGETDEIDALADFNIANLCATYLLLGNFETQIKRKAIEYPVIQAPGSWISTIMPTRLQPLTTVLEYASKYVLPARNRRTSVYKTENIARHYTKEATSFDGLCDRFPLLAYISGHWLHHFAKMDGEPPLLAKLLFESCLSFPYLPQMKGFEKPEWRAMVYWACENDNLTVLKMIRSDSSEATRYGTGPETLRPDDPPLLFHAARHGSERIVAYILSEYEKIQKLSAYLGKVREYTGGHTAFTIASKMGYSKIVDMFVAAEGSRETSATYLLTPLLAATEAGHLDVVKQLVNARLKIDGVTPYEAFQNLKNGETDIWVMMWLLPLKIAAKAGHYVIVKHLCEQEFYIPNLHSLCRMEDPKWALHQWNEKKLSDTGVLASYWHNILNLEFLSQQSEDPYEKHFKIPLDPLKMAVLKGHHKIIEYLLLHTEDYRSVIPALSAAIDNGDTKAVRSIVIRMRMLVQDESVDAESRKVIRCYCGSYALKGGASEAIGAGEAHKLMWLSGKFYRGMTQNPNYQYGYEEFLGAAGSMDTSRGSYDDFSLSPRLRRLMKTDGQF